MGSLFAFFGASCWNFVLAEFDGIERALELLARVEAGQHSVDLVRAHLFGGICTFGVGLQPETAEITQFHDIAFRQFAGNNGEEGI